MPAFPSNLLAISPERVRLDLDGSVLGLRYRFPAFFPISFSKPLTSLTIFNTAFHFFSALNSVPRPFRSPYGPIPPRVFLSENLWCWGCNLRIFVRISYRNRVLTNCRRSSLSINLSFGSGAKQFCINLFTTKTTYEGIGSENKRSPLAAWWKLNHLRSESSPNFSSTITRV